MTLAEVNAVHPFRQGNGRFERAFFGQLACDAGYEIARDHLDAQDNINASIASINGDISQLAALLGDIAKPLDARP